MNALSTIDHELGSFSSSLLDLTDEFFARICEAYRRSAASLSDEDSALWRSIAGRSSHIHDAIIAGGDVRSIVSDPASNYLFFGFDNLFLDAYSDLSSSADLQRSRHSEVAFMLHQLASALGVGRLYNVEFGHDHPHTAGNPASAAAALAGVEEVVGPLSFPNPFPGEHGIDTGKGIVSHRAIHAVYGAWRSKALSQHFGPRVLEIGAGLGRSAYFSHLLGITDYTIVDLPLTSLCQALFLGAALGEDMVTLSGEDRVKGRIALLPPGDLTDDYDLIVNVDSITEMGAEAADTYAALTPKAFLSINHEANERTAGQILGAKADCLMRAPYWLRPGYVEELFVRSSEP